MTGVLNENKKQDSFTQPHITGTKWLRYPRTDTQIADRHLQTVCKRIYDNDNDKDKEILSQHANRL